jgi:uncharacterized paraquat-inducible protein A
MPSEHVELILTDHSVFLNQKCSFCDKTLKKTGERIILCSGCHRINHRECWEKQEICLHCKKNEDKKDRQSGEISYKKTFLIQGIIISICLILSFILIWNNIQGKIMNKHKMKGILYYKDENMIRL